MARALYNKLNKYNLGGLVKRYDHGGEHAADGSPIYGGDTFVKAEDGTGTSIYTTKRNHPLQAGEGEKDANEATKGAIVSDIKNIQTDEFKDKVKELFRSEKISRRDYNMLVGGGAQASPIKTMSLMSNLGLINLEDYSSFNDRVNFFTAGWGDQTRSDFIKGITSEVLKENSINEQGLQLSEDNFSENMYKGADPSKGFKGSLTNKDGELEYKDRPGLGGKQTFGRHVESNRVYLNPSASYTYTEGVKDEEVIEDEQTVVEDDQIQDEQTVVEEKVDVDEIPVKDPVKPPTVVKKDIVPVEEKVVEEDEGEVVEVIDTKPDFGPPIDYRTDIYTDHTGGMNTLATGPYSQTESAIDKQFNNPFGGLKVLKEGEELKTGGKLTGNKLYKRGGLAMLAKRGMKYNQGGRPSGRRMTNQELGRLLSKYNVR